MSEFMARPYCPRCKRHHGCGCGLGLIDLDGELIVDEDERYDSLFRYYASLHGLSWRRIKAQAVAESSLDPRSVSPVGAVGLMQFMPSTWGEWGRGAPTDPEASIEAACRYMAHLYECYGEIPDDTERYRSALAAYNCGRGNWNQALALAREACGLPSSYSEWASSGRKPGQWQTFSFASRHLERVTGTLSRETIGYVRRISPW